MTPFRCPMAHLNNMLSNACATDAHAFGRVVIIVFGRVSFSIDNKHVWHPWRYSVDRWPHLDHLFSNVRATDAQTVVRVLLCAVEYLSVPINKRSGTHGASLSIDGHIWVTCSGMFVRQIHEWLGECFQLSLVVFVSR